MHKTFTGLGTKFAKRWSVPSRLDHVKRQNRVMQNTNRSIMLFLCVAVIISTGTNALADSRESGKSRMMVGVDANYSLDLMKNGSVWKLGKKPVDLFAMLHKSGVDSFRVRVWTGNSGSSGRDYALAVAQRAQKAGMKPFLVFFLSEDWADYVRQPAPTQWRSLAFDEKLKAITQYSKSTALCFKSSGVSTDLYGIGNEIDFGICGEFAEDWSVRFNTDYMSKHIWNREASIIAAAEQGIRSVDPSARFVLHLAQWWNPPFCEKFLQVMKASKVQVDYLGLSYYPTAGLGNDNSFDGLALCVRQIDAKTGLPVIICECGYPSTPSFGGQFASWNKAVSGFELSENGQKKWIAEMLSIDKTVPQIKGVFYWSPEYYTQELWSAFSLFRTDGTAKEGLSAFGRGRQ